jgi:hypothetical protein
MKITYKCEYTDHYEAQLMGNAKQRLIMLRTTLAAFTFFCVVGFLATDPQDKYRFPLLGLMFLGVIPIYQLRQKLLLRSIKKAYERGGGDKQNEVEITEDGIQNLNSQDKQPWSYFSRYSESPNDFILYRANMIYAIFPKRAFDNAGLEFFRRILKARLSQL